MSASAHTPARTPVVAPPIAARALLVRGLLVGLLAGRFPRLPAPLLALMLAPPLLWLGII